MEEEGQRSKRKWKRKREGEQMRSAKGAPRVHLAHLEYLEHLDIDHSCPDLSLAPVLVLCRDLCLDLCLSLVLSPSLCPLLFLFLAL